MSGLLGRSRHAFGLRVGRRQRERTRALRLASAPLAQASLGRPGGDHAAPFFRWSRTDSMKGRRLIGLPM